jgi:hypothetical protein
MKTALKHGVSRSKKRIKKKDMETDFWKEMKNRKMGTVEPRYNDSRVMLTENDCICDDVLAFIYGAIKKYGTDKEYLEDLRVYIKEMANDIGKK